MTDLPWEDNLLERKLESDLRDLPKTLVAFANSVKPEHKATILIGERDDGTVQGVSNPDNIQKKIRKDCDKIYPPILWKSIVYEKDEKHCVRVEIEYDGETPHFGDAAWVRRGSETIKATDEVFQKLIELRLGKVRELAKWVGKEITIEFDSGTIIESHYGASSKQLKPLLYKLETATLLEVNNFWATLYIKEGKDSEPLRNITLSWDNKEDRLMLVVKGDMIRNK